MRKHHVFLVAWILLCGAGHTLASTASPGLTACPTQAEVWVDHYVALAFRESPFEDIVGTHRLTADAARTRNHYRFAYGVDRRLISVRFALGDTPRNPDHTGNALFDTPIMDICYQDGIEIRHFRDVHGNPVYSRGNVAEEIYRLDENGYRTALIFHDADGNAIENGWGIATYAWSMQKDGSVIEDRQNALGNPAEIRPGFPFYRLRLKFGPNGWLALMENVDADGKLVQNPMNAAQDKLEYRANGEMLAWNVYDANEKRAEGNGPMVARGIRGFTIDGVEITERYEDRHGKAILNAYGFQNSLASFDRFGNMLSRFSRTPEGELSTNPHTGYAGYRMRWDDSGLRRLRLHYEDVSGQPATHAQRGIHGIVERYDAEGDRVELEYVDVSGKRVNRSDTGVALERMDYDGRHRLVSRRYFDSAGNPVSVNGKTETTYRYRPDGYPEANAN